MRQQIQGLIITRSVNYPQLLIDPFVTESMPSSALQQYLTAYRGINDWHLYARTLTGTVTAHRWMDEIGNWVTTGSWVGAGWVTTGSWVGAGDGYLVIWHYDSRLERQDYGVIIEL
jgi:hypothetical protein